MSKIFVPKCIALLVIILILSPCHALRSGGKGSSGKGSKDPVNPKTNYGSSGTSNISPNTPGRGVGISAWGIIILVVSLILAGAGMYYFSICYPVLCKKPRKYNMIGLSSVA